MIPYSEVTAEAAFSLSTTSPVNLKKRSEYTLTLTNPRLTTSIILGQLESCIIDSAVLEFPDTSKFGVSFLAKANIGDIVSFGNYRVADEGQVTIYYDGIEGTDILGEIHLVDDKVRRYSISFDGESVAIRIDDQDHEFPAPVDESITHLDLLDAGGILDSIFYWSRPITKFEHQSLLDSGIELEDQPHLVKMAMEELFMYPVVRELDSDTNPSFDPDAVGWVSIFDSASYIMSNYAPVESGSFIGVLPEEVTVVGNVTVAEFLDGHIYADPYVDLNVGGIAPGDFIHPIWRSSTVGSRGKVEVEQKDVFNQIWRQEEPPPAGTIYRWTGDPHNSKSEKVVDGEIIAQNMSTNPSAETTFDGWNLYAGPMASREITDEDYWSGSHSVKVTLDSGNDIGVRIYGFTDHRAFDALPEGTSFAFKVRAKLVSDLTPRPTAHIFYRDSESANPGNFEVLTESPWVDIGNGWVEVSASGTVPEGNSLTDIYIMFRQQPVAEWNSGDHSYWDGLFLVTAPTEEEAMVAVQDYFDGDNADDRANDLWIDTDTGLLHTWDGNLKDWQEVSPDLSTLSFWMDPFEGEVMPGVTMESGVLSGATFVNGEEYDGRILEDRFMLTVYNPPGEFTINADITNLMTSESLLTQPEVRDLYESFFILPVIKTLPDTSPVSEGGVFTIDATWNIVTSG